MSERTGCSHSFIIAATILGFLVDSIALLALFSSGGSLRVPGLSITIEREGLGRTLILSAGFFVAYSIVNRSTWQQWQELPHWMRNRWLIFWFVGASLAFFGLLLTNGIPGVRIGP